MIKSLRSVFTLLIIVFIFFYPIFLKQIPFPGDLLVGYYSPYNSNSYGGYAPGGVPNKAQGPDVIRQLFPWKYFVVESLKKGEIPFWNPYNFSGNPLMANFQSGVFYPLNLLFLKDFIFGWTMYIIAIPLLSSFFMYLFLRSKKLEKIPSIFGSVVFAFSSYMTVWMEYGNIGHTLLWLPLVLLITERLIQKIDYKNIILTVFVFSLSFLGGYIQGYFYITIVGFFYFLIKSITGQKKRFKEILIYIGIILIPLSLCSFQLFPTLELFRFSTRGNYSLSQIQHLLNPWWYLITIVVPNFFGNPATRNHWFYGTYVERVSYFGFIPFIFAVYAITFFRKSKDVFIFSVVFISSLLLATDAFFTKYFYLIPLPTISTTVPTRILSLFVFSGSILSSYGFQFYTEKKELKKLLINVFLITAVLIFSWGYTSFMVLLNHSASINENFIVSRKNLILPTIFLLLFLPCVAVSFFKKNTYRFIPVFILLITCVDLLYFFHKITPFSPKEYVFPKTEILQYIRENAGINRFWGYGSASYDSNFSTYEKLYVTDGYEPLHDKSYGELLSVSKDGVIQNPLPRSDANMQGGYGDEDLQKNMYRQRILNLLGVKYILHKPLGDTNNSDYATFPERIYKQVWHNGTTQIYENLQALPRIFLAGNYFLEKDKKRIVSLIMDPKLDLRNTIILEEKIPPNFQLAKDEMARVVIKKYSSNKIVLATQSKTAQLLFLSDTYFPGWRVNIDGKSSTIYIADYSFRAIPIGSGIHTVELWYYPESFKWGIKVSLVTFIAIAGYFLFNLSKKKHD